ncbi:MAG: aconitate hydratase AcnA [bacterium]|nr:aconitate hydratase AcnA [bacterium]
MGKNHDYFSTQRSLELSDGSKVSYYSLPELEKAGFNHIAKLPYSLRVLLESALRNCDEFVFTKDHVAQLANWTPKGNREEVPYKPARVVLQDFTGVPAVVDLAAMRDAMTRLGGDPERINPLVPCDLVIDHSVQVDYFGGSDSLGRNEELEFSRNNERYEFLKWGQTAFSNFRVVPPSTGIVHQVNLEYLASGVFLDEKNAVAYPDSCVGTDSHTPMVDGMGVLSWGVGGIEAEAVMLGQPIYMLVPDVIGFKLTGKMPEGTTATDLVLKITEVCRKYGVVGKFVEFFGPGVETMSVADRATVSNMAPEQGSTVAFFPVDQKTLEFLRLSGRNEKTIELVEKYSRAQGMFVTADSPEPEYSDVIELDLSTVEPALAGPKRPHDRLPLTQVGPTFNSVLSAPIGPRGYGLSPDKLNASATVHFKDGSSSEIKNGAVVIAAITSCTNTSNPSVMLAAGLVAKKAVEKGLTVKPYVKTSLAPGSRVVTEYLKKSGLNTYLDKLGFQTVGYGCTTCIGNSGPLPEEVASAINEGDIVASAVLSGNRNFEGRVNPLTRTNYLASPPLVVAYALFGTTAGDITKDAIGTDKNGKPVYLADIWPTSAEITAAVTNNVSGEMFSREYADAWKGSPAWQKIQAPTGKLYSWNKSSTYVQCPPFFDQISKDKQEIKAIHKARCIAKFADSVTTDHISPAGSIAATSPAAKYLLGHGVEKKDFNSYGSRRGNDHVMKRGTFANIRLKNQLIPNSEGNVTVHFPSGQQTTIFDAAELYAKERTPLVVLAGKEYGSGSSRDWAAKGPFLLGIRAAIAESYERIHRSNLIGMGILPLQFVEGQSASSLGLTGEEIFEIAINDSTKPQEIVKVTATLGDKTITFDTISRIDTPIEVEYYREGGILNWVLKSLSRE